MNKLNLEENKKNEGPECQTLQANEGQEIKQGETDSFVEK